MVGLARTPLPAHGDHADLGAGGDLAVHARVVAGHVLGEVAVEVAHKAAQDLDRGVEGPVGTPVVRVGTGLGVRDHEAVEATPEVVEPLDELVQRPPARQERLALRGGVGEALQRVVGQQAQPVDQPGALARVAALDAEGLEHRRVVRPKVIDVELDDAREGDALDQLLRGRADGALGVEDDLSGVDVEAEQRHGRKTTTGRWERRMAGGRGRA